MSWTLKTKTHWGLRDEWTHSSRRKYLPCSRGVQERIYRPPIVGECIASMQADGRVPFFTNGNKLRCAYVYAIGDYLGFASWLMIDYPDQYIVRLIEPYWDENPVTQIDGSIWEVTDLGGNQVTDHYMVPYANTRHYPNFPWLADVPKRMSGAISCHVIDRNWLGSVVDGSVNTVEFAWWKHNRAVLGKSMRVLGFPASWEALDEGEANGFAQILAGNNIVVPSPAIEEYEV